MKNNGPVVAVTVLAVLMVAGGISIYMDGSPRISNPEHHHPDMTPPHHGPVEVAPRENNGAAESMAEKFITDQLKAPTTAKFDNAHSVEQKDGYWLVTGTVDAQNTYGAMLRSRYVCKVRNVTPLAKTPQEANEPQRWEKGECGLF